jgi:hypothetical protein
VRTWWCSSYFWMTYFMARETWTWPWRKEGIYKGRKEARLVIQFKHPAVWSEVKQCLKKSVCLRKFLKSSLLLHMHPPISRGIINFKAISKRVYYNKVSLSVFGEIDNLRSPNHSKFRQIVCVLLAYRKLILKMCKIVSE